LVGLKQNQGVNKRRRKDWLVDSVKMDCEGKRVRLSLGGERRDRSNNLDIRGSWSLLRGTSRGWGRKNQDGGRKTQQGVLRFCPKCRKTRRGQKLVSLERGGKVVMKRKEGIRSLPVRQGGKKEGID